MRSLYHATYSAPLSLRLAWGSRHGQRWTFHSTWCGHRGLRAWPCHPAVVSAIKQRWRISPGLDLYHIARDHAGVFSWKSPFDKGVFLQQRGGRGQQTQSNGRNTCRSRCRDITEHPAHNSFHGRTRRPWRPRSELSYRFCLPGIPLRALTPGPGGGHHERPAA